MDGHRHHTVTEENYLKVIYKFSEGEQLVSTNTIARFLETTPASVTDMVKKLNEKKLVEHHPYQGVRLTSTGRQVALGIIRKHRLWEVFLVNTLKFSWDKVHDTAEQLEHIEAPELIDALDAFLGHPKFDPHGDPIPSREGEIHERDTVRLSDAAEQTLVTVAGVSVHTTEFLQYLDKVGLNIGSHVLVAERITFDKSLILRIGSREVVLNGETASQILVVPSPEAP